MKVAKQWSAQVMLAALVVSTAVGCGAAKKPQTPVNAKPAKPSAEPVAIREKIAPHTCAARTRLAELLGHKEPPPPAAAVENPDSAAPPTSVMGAKRVPANQAYRVVAPATVLVRTPNGMGTGVVVDARGYILTNYHVIADGRKQDFVQTVDVTFGDLTATGRMSRQPKSYEAVVVKADVIRDLALVKLTSAPPKVEAVKLAKSAPQIAEKVISVGHAGIGFLWAAKTCSIASVGERQQDTSRLAAMTCTNPDPAMTAAEATRYQARCDETKKAMTEALQATTQGLAIQTDCAITRGDSGGPLVNASGELVGLNQSISADMATASFHVHLDELRDFASTLPEEALAMVPDPFCDGGNQPTFEDLDLDGVPDTLVNRGASSMLGGYDRMSLIIDLDQSHFSKTDVKAPAVDGAPMFDAEIALLTIQNTTYVWYDTDEDAKFDLMLVDKDSDGQPEKAYRIGKDGAPKEDRDALPTHDLSAKYVKNAALHGRLGKIANAFGGAKYLSAKMLTAASSNALPDPLLGGGSTGRALDTDGNGKSDVAAMRGAFSRAVLFDADEDSLAEIASGEAVDDLVKARKVDAEVSIITQGAAVWAFYDTNNDGRFDLALMTSQATTPTSLFATAAWHLGQSPAETTPAPDQLGRKLLRPGLMPAFPRLARSFALVGLDVGTDEGMGSLPDPLLGGKAHFHVHDLGKGSAPGTVVEAQAGPMSVMLFDVDRDTKLPKDPKDADIEKVVSNGTFDAEVAVLHRAGEGGGSDWVYYDTDGDGKLDLVLFVATSGKDATQAYRLTKSGTLTVDAAAVNGRSFRTKSVFKNKAVASKWKTIASKIYKAGSVEE